MTRGTWIILFVAAISLAQMATINSDDSECDPSCTTVIVMAMGTVCVMFIPMPQEIAPFLGFWCADNNLNSTCAMTFDGNYTCACHPGFGGDQCDLVGTPCGGGSCFNNATCFNGTCQCSDDWQGIANCTLGTLDDSTSDGGGGGVKWWGGVLITGSFLFVFSFGGIFGYKKYKERRDIDRFKELQKPKNGGHELQKDFSESDQDFR